MAPVFELSFMDWVVYSIVYTWRQQTKQENSEIIQCFIGHSPPSVPFPNASSKRSSFKRQRHKFVGFALYNSTSIVFYIIFS